MMIHKWLEKINIKRRKTTESINTNSATELSNSASRSDDEAYLSDHPITSAEEDRFNRLPFVQRIADTIARREDPSSLVLGIYGIWGDGKTSALQLLDETLKNNSNIVLIRFNPWHFQSETQLIKGFFATLTEALGRSLPTRKEEIGTILEKYGWVLSLASVSFFDGAVQFNPGAGLHELGQSLSTVELDNLRIRVERILKEERKRVIVLIDDIDRLDRQEIYAIFKLVKLSANFHYTAYILAFDDEMVADALGERYGAGGKEAGRSFLEKIIQVPLHLPPADRLALRKLAFEGVDAALRLSHIELTEEQVYEFGNPFIEGLEPRLITPRQAKRYANALAFGLPILKGEVHAVDQLLLEGVRTFYPKLYAIIRANPDVFLPPPARLQRLTGDDRKRMKDIIQEGYTELTPTEQKAAEGLLQTLFPRLQGVFGNIEFSHETALIWEREKRICADHYFHRYFQYAVPSGDISDQTLERFLDDIAALEESAIGEALKAVTQNGAGDRLIHKLRLREESIAPQIAQRLALAIAQNAAIFPKGKDAFASITSAFPQAAVLIMRLTCRIPMGPERDALTHKVIQEAAPLTFAAECFRWFRRDTPEAQRIISEEVEKELGELLTRRIREAAEEQPPYITFPEEGHSLLWIWSKYGTPDEVRAYLRKRLALYPEEVLKLLTAYTPTAWGGSSGLPHKSDFGREGYNALVEVLEPAEILSYLKSLYGTRLDEASYYVAPDVPDEERVARQFAYIHARGVVGDSDHHEPNLPVEDA